MEFDIIIADDKHKGKGYGSDALQTLSRYLFKEMGVQKCWIEVITGNPRAVKAYRKAGFKIKKKFVDMERKCLHMELSKLDLNTSVL